VCRPERSTVSHSAGCSIRPFEASGRCRVTSALTTIRFIDLGNGKPSANSGGGRNQDSAVRSPVSSVRGAADRNYLDRTLFWTTVDLENKLLEFRDYFNGYRTHHSLEGRTPDQDTTGPRPVANLNSYRWQPHVEACIKHRLLRDSPTTLCLLTGVNSASPETLWLFEFITVADRLI